MQIALKTTACIQPLWCSSWHRFHFFGHVCFWAADLAPLIMKRCVRTEKTNDNNNSIVDGSENNNNNNKNNIQELIANRTSGLDHYIHKFVCDVAVRIAPLLSLFLSLFLSLSLLSMLSLLSYSSLSSSSSSSLPEVSLKVSKMDKIMTSRRCFESTFLSA